MWKLIVDRGMPPTRKARYCCAELKETKGNGRLTVTGVRWEESLNRRNTHGVVDLQGHTKKTVKRADDVGAEYKNNGRNSIILNNDNDASRQVVEHCFRKARTTLNPIVDWSEEDVWEFLNDVAKVPHCRLYDEGYTRLGCIGCPMANTKQRQMDLERFPAYRDAYIRAFQRMIDRRKEKEMSMDYVQKVLEEPTVAGNAGHVNKYIRTDFAGQDDGYRYDDGNAVYRRWQLDNNTASPPHTESLHPSTYTTQTATLRRAAARR